MSYCRSELLILYEGVIELFSHRDDHASRIVSAFVIGDSDDEDTEGRHRWSRVTTAAGAPIEHDGNPGKPTNRRTAL
jgi:hypothetical protein